MLFRSVEMRAVPEFAPVSLKKLTEKSVKRQQMREIIESGENVASIIDVSVTLMPVAANEEGVSVEAAASVVYLNDESRYSLLTRRIQVACQLESGADYSVKATLSDEVTAVPSSEGLELRFCVDFDVTGTANFEINAISDVKIEELPDVSARPSVVLRRCMPNETLWDIAKRYGATRQELARANEIEDVDEMCPGKLLLIPRK